MTEPFVRRIAPPHTGIDTVRARPDQVQKAVRNRKRANRERRLSKKLDELLGTVDDDFEHLDLNESNDWECSP